MQEVFESINVGYDVWSPRYCENIYGVEYNWSKHEKWGDFAL